MPATTGTWYVTSACSPPGTPFSTLRVSVSPVSPLAVSTFSTGESTAGAGGSTTAITSSSFWGPPWSDRRGAGRVRRIALGEISLGELGLIVEAAALEERPEPFGKRIERHAHHLHRVRAAPGHEVDLAERDFLVEVIESPLRATALAPFDRAAHDCLGEHEHVGDVANRVPPGVERATARHANVRAPLAKRLNLGQRASQRLLASADAGVILHR